MPTQAEQDAPLYVPPQSGGDVDLDPVKPCVDADVDAAPQGPPTLTNLRSVLFNPSCTFSSCHGGKTPVHVRLDGGDLHDVLLGDPKLAETDMPLVSPGDPDDSWLYQLVALLRPAGRRRQAPHPHAVQRADPPRRPHRRDPPRLDRRRRAERLTALTGP